MTPLNHPITNINDSKIMGYTKLVKVGQGSSHSYNIFNFMFKEIVLEVAVTKNRPF